MDFISKRIENNLSLCEPGDYNYITYLRVRIEYSLFLCLGYLWKNFGSLAPDKQNAIIKNLHCLSIGSAVAAIRELDRGHKEIITGKKCARLLDDYPLIRNQKIGHGYEMAGNIASALRPLYDDLVSCVPFLKAECDIIVIKQFNSSTDTYEGIRFPMDGYGVRWTCPKELIQPMETAFPRTYISYANQYYKISPFIYLQPDSQMPFVFSSLVEKVIGKVKMCPLFSGLTGIETNDFIFNELIYLSSSEKHRQLSQSNGTIMNKLRLNYDQYIDVGFQELVENFLFKNRAYVYATIWGHGGVGKTACIQKICYDLFNKDEKMFSYIIFVTAKDRTYNPRTGNINSNVGSIQRYSEIIECISRVLFDNAEIDIDSDSKLAEYEQKISDFEDKLLIVIDDYETFADDEKEKISKFLSTLNARYHKVIITTRNKRFILGEAISCNELDLTKTKLFIEAVVKTQYSQQYANVQHLLEDTNTLNHIFVATSGRPIFIYQFIYLYFQKGYKSNLIDGIRTSTNAQEFLYGRIFQYLSKNAQYIFGTISTLADEDLRFNLNVLEHVLSKAIAEREEFDTSVEEISNQKVIELIGDNYARVYSPEILRIMSVQYQAFSQEFRSTVKNLLDSIGGKNVKGSIFEAMLEQADKSRTFGNEKETIEKYRRVLNSTKAPYEIRKTALRHLSDFLSNARINIPAATMTMEEYIGLFPDDADIHILYVYLLWAQGRGEKEKAVNAIQRFFSNHKKTAYKYLTFFALGTGYCIDFDLRYRHYTKEALRKAQYAKTFNEYGRILFNYVEKQIIKSQPALFHNIRVALIQTVKLCEAIGKDGKNHDKVAYGLKICQWMKNSGIREPFLNQIVRLENNLHRLSVDCTPKNDSISPLPELQAKINQEDSAPNDNCFWNEGKQYSIGDTVECKVDHIVNYGVLVSIDSSIKGLIHISKIAPRYIDNIYQEFAEGDICQAEITEFDIAKRQMALSTVKFHN